MATIVLHRPDNWVYGIRKFKVLLDGVAAGAIENGKTWVRDVTPGSHTIQVAIDFLKTKPVELRVAEGDRVECECGCEYTMTDLLIPILTIVRLCQGRRFLYLKKLDRSGPFVGVKTSLKGVVTSR